MVNRKGKGCEQKDLEAQDSGKATFTKLGDSARGLANSVFSSSAYHEVSGSKTSAIRNTEKLQSSSAQAMGGISRMEGGSGSKVKLNHKLRGSRLSPHERHNQRFEEEFSSFSNDMNTFTSFQMIACKKEFQKDNPKFTFSYITEEKTKGLSFAEQESRDGEDIVNLFRNPDQIDCNIRVSSTDEVIADSQRDLFSSPQIQPKNVHGQDLFNFVPDFENSVAHNDQWIDLQENYTETVWGFGLRTSQLMSLESGENELNASQTATQRLRVVWCHLQGKLQIPKAHA